MKNNWKPATLPLLLLAVAPPPLAAAPKIDYKVKHYLVDGVTVEAIRADLNAKSSINEDGEQFDAHINWRVNWRITTRYAGNSCRISSVGTGIKVRYTFPKLQPNPQRPDEVTRKWEQYAHALAIHELGHRKLATAAAERIEQALPAIPGQNSCDKLSRLANAVGDKIVEKYAALNKLYDERTRHGATQGARFP